MLNILWPLDGPVFNLEMFMVCFDHWGHTELTFIWNQLKPFGFTILVTCQYHHYLRIGLNFELKIGTPYLNFKIVQKMGHLFLVCKKNRR